MSNPSQGELDRTGMSVRQPIVLAIDDEPDNIRVLASALENAYDVRVSTNGEAGLMMVDELHPDLIIVDMVMPGMDGLAVLKRLREQARYFNLPVIVVTARHDANAEIAALHAGATDFVHNPFSPDALQARVSIHIEQERLRREIERQKTLLEEQVLQRTLTLQLAREATEATAQREREFRALLESAPDAMIIVDDGGKIVTINAQTEKLFGYHRRELVGKTVEHLIPDRFTQSHVSLREGYADDKHRRMMGNGKTLSALRKDGSEFPASIALSAIEAREGTRYICAVRDVTEAYQSAQALEIALDEASQSNQALQISKEELESFSYSVSHDLRVPLRVVEGFSHLLMERYGDRLDDEGRDLLRRMLVAEQRMGRLINDLLVLSRISRVELQREPIDLSAMVVESARVLHSVHEDHKPQLKIEPHVHVHADAALMRIVVDNLVDNAIKFTRDCDKPLVTFGRVQGAREDTLFVKDNGVGFDLARAEKLFEAFQRFHAPEEYPGTGVGLATVRRIVTKHGGKVWVESAPGAGTTVCFTLQT